MATLKNAAIAVVVLLFFWKVIIGAQVVAAAPAPACENVYPHRLDVGIYWAAPDPATGLLRWEKSCIGDVPVLSSHFNPARPTLIMTHGLQPDFVEKGFRMWAESETMQFALPWIMSGFNVGIFQWTQFADELLVHFERAEAKIWTPKYYAKMAFTYKTADGAVAVADAPSDASVAQLFVRHYLAHARLMPPGTEVRLIGHSLGSQLVMLTTFLLHSEHAGENVVLPERVAMLDPVYSPHQKAFLMDGNSYKTGFDADDLGTVQAMLAGITRFLHMNRVAVEVYRFSFINRCLFSSQSNSGIFHHAAFSQPTIYTWGDRHLGKCYSPDLFSSLDYNVIKDKIDDLTFQMKNQHIIALPWYLTSLVIPPHKCVLQNSGTPDEVCVPLRGHALSAATSTEEVIAQMDATDADDMQCYHQYDDGRRTPDASVMNPFSPEAVFYVHPCADSNT